MRNFGMPILLLMIICGIVTFVQAAIIPVPQQLEIREGVFTIQKSSSISVPSGEYTPVAELLRENIYLKTEIMLSSVTIGEESQAIVFAIDSTMNDQSYTIIIEKQIRVTAANYNSLVLGAASLLQMTQSDGQTLTVPKMNITDSPELAYRGIMVDVARAWIPADVLKQTLDLMHIYKYNYLHLHLSDTQSYVLPSKAYPKLPTFNKDGSRRHYTPQEISEIVDYAKIRGVILIPEVDVPGHASQLVSKVPEVFGTIDQKTGKPVGRGAVVNMVSEKTYEGIDTLIGEIVELFPDSPYIHIGGDEVWARHLLNYPEYKEYTKKYNLTKAEKGNLEELLVHFIGRVDVLVKKHNRKTIIWEGFRGKGTENTLLSTDMIVMAWNTSYQKPQSLIDNGFSIINCTWLPLYIVPPQNRVSSQEKAYAWNYRKFDHWKTGIKPIQLPSNQDLLGAQICLWEQKHELVVPLLKHLMPAISERIWNADSGQEFTEFEKKQFSLQNDLNRIVEPVEIIADGLLENSDLNFTDNLKVTLNKKPAGVVRYTLSNGYNDFPTSESEEYQLPIMLTDTTTVTAQLFDKDKNPIGGISQKRFTKIIPAYYYKAYSPKNENHWYQMPDVSNLRPDRSGYIGFSNSDRVKQFNRTFVDLKNPFGHIDTRPEKMWNSYAIVLEGQIEIPESGKYKIQFTAKDGAGELLLDNQKIAYNLVMGSKDVVVGELKKGIYTFTINYFYRFLFNELNIQIKRPGQEKFEPFESFILPVSKHKPKCMLNSINDELEFTFPVQQANWNLALNKPTKTSSASDPGQPARYINDGLCTNQSSWFSGPYPQTLEIDLESLNTINRIKVYPYYDNRRYYQYVIATSTDDIDWEEVVDMSQNNEKSTKKGHEHTFDRKLARYIKITVLKNSANRGVHINELMVFEAK